MSEGAFLDTNILVYSVSADPTRAEVAHQLLRGGGHVSVQVCNEFASVALRKLSMPVAEIGVVLQAVFTTCEVHDLTLETHLGALRLVDRYGFSFYDALLAQSAVTAGCDTLWSEDFQNGFKVGRSLTIRNPFAPVSGS